MTFPCAQTGHVRTRAERIRTTSKTRVLIVCWVCRITRCFLFRRSVVTLRKYLIQGSHSLLPLAYNTHLVLPTCNNNITLRDSCRLNHINAIERTARATAASSYKVLAPLRQISNFPPGRCMVWAVFSTMGRVPTTTPGDAYAYGNIPTRSFRSHPFLPLCPPLCFREKRPTNRVFSSAYN